MLDLRTDYGEQTDSEPVQTEAQAWQLEAKADRRRAGNLRAAVFKPRLNLHKIFWLFVICAIIGFCLETLYFFIKYRHFFGSKGLLYGPFSQVYGCGGVILAATLSSLVKKGYSVLFLASAIVGGLFEAFCSLLQEGTLGSVSWDYTYQSLFLMGGRTSVAAMLYWGVLGVVFMKKIYPSFSIWIDSLPKRQDHLVTRIAAIFMIVNMVLTLAAVHRWSERTRLIAPEHSIDVLLDTYYPDDYMRKNYPGMRFE